MDELLPDVLIFAAGTDLHDHPLVADGRLILQVRTCCAQTCTMSCWKSIASQQIAVCCNMRYHGHALGLSSWVAHIVLCMHGM